MEKGFRNMLFYLILKEFFFPGNLFNLIDDCSFDVTNYFYAFVLKYDINLYIVIFVSEFF